MAAFACGSQQHSPRHKHLELCMRLLFSCIRLHPLLRMALSMTYFVAGRNSGGKVFLMDKIAEAEGTLQCQAGTRHTPMLGGGG